ncbi:MAG: hypothetical protein QMC40_04130 [Vicingaceae bacterium]|jgi:hypothetical protein|tara:strand:+ start:1319 stop:1801 length:483 start_codon:yes stop_codon:yes gene_type:complete
MKNKKPILIILFFSILSFSSCKDDDDTGPMIRPATPTNTEKLCAKNFILTDVTTILNGDTISTGLDTNSFDACALDDILRCETSGIYTDDSGAIKCDTTEPQILYGTWEFYDSETKLIFDKGPDGDTLNIITNDGTLLAVGLSYIDMGDTIEFVQTLTAQ